MQYIRIFVPQKRSGLSFWASHALIWTNLVFFSAAARMVIFGCKPMAMAWDPLITDGRCLNRMRLIIASGVMNSITDLLIILAPQKAIWTLRMSLHKKLAISAIFLFGVLWVHISSIPRAPLIRQSSSWVGSVAGLCYRIRAAHSDNLTYYVGVFGFCTYFELSFGIIAFCLPSTPKFFQTFKSSNLPTKLSSSIRANLSTSIIGSIWRRSKNGFTGPSVSMGDSRETGKITPKHYSPLGESYGMSDMNIQSRSPGTFKDIERRSRQADTRILRTVEISTVGESTSNVGPDIERGGAGPWDGQDHDSVQQTRIYVWASPETVLNWHVQRSSQDSYILVVNQSVRVGFKIRLGYSSYSSYSIGYGNLLRSTLLILEFSEFLGGMGSYGCTLTPWHAIADHCPASLLLA